MHHLPFEILWLAGALIGSYLAGGACERKGQPRVLGGLIVGIIFAIAFGETKLLTDIREMHSPFISHLANMGAMIILFKAGLESNMAGIRRGIKVSGSVAIIGVIFPMIGGTIAAKAFFDLNWTKATFVGGVFAATSVAVSAAVLGSKGLSKSSFGQTINQAAVVDDVLTLLALTICLTLNAPTGDLNVMQIVMQFGAVIGFIVFVPAAGGYFAERMMRSLHRFDKTHSGALVIGWMLFYAFLGELVGLAGIVGAYFAGVALEEHHFTHDDAEEVHNRLERFVHHAEEFLGPVFFVYSTCLIDMSVFTQPKTLFIGIVFSVIAIVGKIMSGLGATPGNRLIVGIGMIARGEVGIIFGMLGLKAGIFNEQVFGACMIMIVVTTVISPLLLNWALRKKAEEPDADLENPGLLVANDDGAL